MRKKDFWLIIAAVVAALTLAIGQFASEVITTGSWGLSFPSSGSAPNGPTSRETLRQYDAAYVGDPDERILYLTFDAGYETGHTATILDTLKKHNVKAAFFLVGNYLQKNADLVRRMVEEGHDCTEVLVQLAAVRSALDNTGKVILQDHMRHCMVDAVTAGDEDAIDDLCQAIDKFMK